MNGQSDVHGIVRRGFVFERERDPAALNFGDCFSYALARVRGEALLFKGTDFSQTDVPAAL
jgi:ribonuclease VapC